MLMRGDGHGNAIGMPACSTTTPTAPPLPQKRLASMSTAQNERRAQMRNIAETRLLGGTAPPSRGSPAAGVEALALLHSLASAPDSASAALKLLHELQVHQVELDLQHEQAEQDRQELGGALQRHADWFEFAPYACLAIGDDGTLQAINQGAARWLGSQPAAAVGLRLDEFLALASRTWLPDLLGQLRAGQASVRAPLRALNGGDEVDATATLPPGGRTVLLAFLPTQSAGPR